MRFLIAMLLVACGVSSVDAGGFGFSLGFTSGRNFNRQRVVVQQRFVQPQRFVQRQNFGYHRQNVVVRQQFVQPQVIYTQPIVQPTYSAFVQRQYVAPVQVQAVQGGNCAAFFSGGY